jgi:hypothetical protein
MTGALSHWRAVMENLSMECRECGTAIHPCPCCGYWAGPGGSLSCPVSETGRHILRAHR